jgi:RNA polymerase sigma-70 factor (ECF subfamily)
MLTSHDAITVDRILATTFAAWLSTADRASYRPSRMQQRDGGTAPAGEQAKRDRLTHLMKAYGDLVFRYCLRKLRNRALAEDVHQQVFIEAYRDLDGFQGRSSDSTWLIGIARHRCQDATRSRERRDKRERLDSRTVDDTVDSDADMAELLDAPRVSEFLTVCLDALPEASRRAVVMRFRDGMSYEDMAIALNAKADTLRARVARALPLIKECLETKGVML